MNFNYSNPKSARELGNSGITELHQHYRESGFRTAGINNRRYLGNKYGITPFIKSTVASNCINVNTFVDIFAGTGAVSSAFSDKRLITNDILYSNYLAHIAWFSPEDYRPDVVIDLVASFNRNTASTTNYFSENFSNTYFSEAVATKIGSIRDELEELKGQNAVSEKEFAILTTSLLYGMDRIANTVGHYDAYRKNVPLTEELTVPLILPLPEVNSRNLCFNEDANELIREIRGDVLYLDPPYNSRQYSDAYHLLENVARWEKPEVHGIARKMDRSAIKSAYSTVKAADALRHLVQHADSRYILLSYNNMGQQGNGRSNAKISDEEILSILNEKGSVEIHETSHRAFNAGKAKYPANSERLFLCKVKNKRAVSPPIIVSPINYTGGKGKLLPQIQPLLRPSDLFVDLFAGGCTVGLNASSDQIVFNDKDAHVIDLIQFLAEQPAQDIIKAVDEIISHYGLSDTYKHSYRHYNCSSSAGLASHNKDAYLRLRADFNAEDSPYRRQLMLYVLVIFAFNNQIRFNSKGEFNLPVGKRDFNTRMRSKLLDFNERMRGRNPKFSAKDFRDFAIADTPQSTLFYCDPPYLITQAVYNERNGWSEKDEVDLLDYLDRINGLGRFFALSNVLEAKGLRNDVLGRWLEERNYVVHDLNMNYGNSNYQRANRDTATTEILVTNY